MGCQLQGNGKEVGLPGWTNAFLDGLQGLGDELMHLEAYLDRLNHKTPS